MRKKEATAERVQPEAAQSHETTEELDALRASMACLPERQRTLLALYFGAEMSQEEIGRHLDMPQSSVSRSINELLAKLRVNLGRAGFAAAAPALGAERMQAVVLGGETPPPGLHEQIAARLAEAGRSVSVKAAAASGASMIWLGSAAAALLLAAAAWWMLQPPPEQPAAAHVASEKTETSAETGPTVIKLPDIDSTSRTVIPAPAAAKTKPYNYRWTFDGKLPDDFKMIAGELKFVRVRDTGRKGLLLPNEGFVCMMIDVPMRGRPLYFKASVQRAKLIGKTQLGFMVTDGINHCAAEIWLDPDINWDMKRVESYEFYVAGEWGFAYAGGKVRAVTRLIMEPEERYLAMGGNKGIVYDMAFREIEREAMPAETRDPQALIKTMKRMPDSKRGVIGEPDEPGEQAPVKN